MNKTQKEFDRSVCFTFYRSFHEQIMDVKRDFGLEAAFQVYEAIANYGLYGTEIEKGKLKTLVGNTTFEQIENSQSRRSNGFAQEDFNSTYAIVVYHRDHPEASQRTIAEAVGVGKTKVQRTLIKIRESGLSIDDYIKDVISPNINFNDNNNSTSYSYSMGQDQCDQVDQSQGTHSTELANAQTAASTMHFKEEEEENRIELRLLKDLKEEELDNLLDDYRRNIKYSVLQKKYRLANNILSRNLPNEIKDIKTERQQEIEKIKTIARKENLKTELFKYPDKKSKLMKFTECTSDEVLFKCLENINHNIDDIIAFYEDNIDAINEHNEPSFKRWTWKSRLAGQFNTYETYIREVMNSNGYSEHAS